MMLEIYLKQIIEESVRKVIQEELQKTVQPSISQTDQEALKILQAKRITNETDWEGVYLSREEWEEIAIRYSAISAEVIDYELGRKAADIANDEGRVQDLGDEIEKYMNEYGFTKAFLNKSSISRFRTIVNLYVDTWGISLDTLYDVPICQLYALHKDGIVNNKREAQRVVRLFKSGKTGKEIREGS